MPKILQKLFSTLLIGTLTACTTPYQDIGMMGGVEQTKLANDAYMIRVQINSLTPRANITDYALLRASELALADGYPYFIVTNGEDITTSTAVPLPGYSQTNGAAFATGSDGSAMAMGSSTTTTMPPMAFTAAVPEARFTIKMFKTKSKTGGMVMEAAIIKASLAPKYIHAQQN